MVAIRIRFGVATVVAGLLLGGSVVMIRRGHESPAVKSDAPGFVAAAGIVLSSDRLDFGELPLHGSVVRQLLLRNSGSRATHVRIESPGAAFTVDPPELALEPGAIGRVLVTANTRRPGSLKDVLRIFADDPSSAPLMVALEASADTGAPEGTVTQASDAGASAPIGVSGAGETRGLTPGTLVSGALGTGGQAALPGSAESSVVIARTSNIPGPDGAAGNADGGQATRGGSPGTPVAPFGLTPPPRGISDRPNGPRSGEPQREGEQPTPLGRNPKSPGVPEPKPRDPVRPPPSAPTFVISPASTLTLLGSANQFYPQQVGVQGSATGGSFSLASLLELPRIPLAFGQSVVFHQTGSAEGSFDPASGQVTMTLPIEAVDANGSAAPLVLSMTTGTVVTRNNSGVLISVVGQPRAQDSGVLRLVGIGKIPPGYRNGAEEQLLSVDMMASLSFPDVVSTEASSGSAGGGN